MWRKVKVKLCGECSSSSSSPSFFGGGENGAYAEEKAWVKYDNGTLTFQYGEKASLGTDEYWLNRGSNSPDWSKRNRDVTKVVFDQSFGKALPTSSHEWFKDFLNLSAIEGIEYLNTSNVTNMESMFQYCSKLTSLDLSRFNTSNVTTMSEMFQFCSKLTSLDVSNFNTSKVYNMSRMFKQCDGLTSVDVSGFNTSNVTLMSEMFSSCSKLTSLDVSNFNTSKVSNMEYMFAYCSKLASVDVSDFNTSNARGMRGMFYKCSNLISIFASDKFVTSGVTDDYHGENMFAYCTKLVGDIAYDESKVDKTYAKFDGGYFRDKNLADRPWVKYTDGTLTFQYGYKKTLGTDEYWLNEGSDTPGWYGKRAGIKTVVFDKSFSKALPTSCSRWFYGCGNLSAIKGIENLNTSSVTNMEYMFNDCKTLTSLDVSRFNTSNVTDMARMFESCRELTSLDVSNFNTSKVTNMKYMFYNCNLLTTLDVSNFNTSEVTEVNLMFYCCYGLTSLDVSNFNTSKVTDMSNMFMGCSNLESIFASDKFVTSSLTNKSYGGDMFRGCTKLVGDIAYDAGKVDMTYAKIEGGYFLDKQYVRPWVKYANGTLTFHYGYKKTLGTDEYCLNEGGDIPGWYDKRDGIKTVVFDQSFSKALPTSCSRWFYGCGNLSAIKGIESLNTSEVTNMEYMFYDCRALTSLDVSKFNTSNVTSMRGMFQSCRVLTSLDVSNFNTSNVTNMSGMFHDCNGLTSLDVSNFDTSKVTNMKCMFRNCNGLTSLVVSNFDTSKVMEMYQMFDDCSSLTTLDLSNFNTSKVTDMGYMFAYCSNLESIFASDKFVTSSLTNDSFGSKMFRGCTKLVGDIAYDAGKVDMTYAKLDGGYFRDKNLPDRPWAKCTDGTLTFQYGYKKTLGTDEYWLNEGSSVPGWVAKRSSIAKVVFDTTFAQARPTTCYFWFYDCVGVSAIDGIEYLNTSCVTSMHSMFDGCSSLTSLDLSSFNTSCVTSMYSMFDGCSSLTSLDLSSFNTSCVKDMRYMFNGCSGLTSLDVSNFNTSNVTVMTSMFRFCTKLTSLDVTSFNTSNVTDMCAMFCVCSSLTSLDVSSFNTSNVTNMSSVFVSTTSLKSIYFGDGFKVDQLESTDYDRMFDNCPATLYCSPKQYDSFKNNGITSFGNAVKPYVSINQKSEYGTLCVPVGSSLAEGSFTGFDKIYQVQHADKDEGTITLAEAKSIVSGMPYVYHRYLDGVDFEGKNAMSVITFDVDENASAAVPAPKNEGSMLKGTFESMVAPGGSYILQTDGNFHPVAEDNKTLRVGAYRAYLDLTSAEIGGDDEEFADAKAYRMVFEDGEATGIGRINGSDKGVYDQADQQPKIYFDVMGHKVNAPQKGEIYIVNGKKVVNNK